MSDIDTSRDICLQLTIDVELLDWNSLLALRGVSREWKNNKSIKLELIDKFDYTYKLDPEYLKQNNMNQQMIEHREKKEKNALKLPLITPLSFNFARMLYQNVILDDVFTENLLFDVCDKCNNNTIKWIITRFSLNTINCDTLFKTICKKNDLELVNWFIHLCKIETKEKYIITAFIESCSKNKPGVAKWLYNRFKLTRNDIDIYEHQPMCIYCLSYHYHQQTILDGLFLSKMNDHLFLNLYKDMNNLPINSFLNNNSENLHGLLLKICENSKFGFVKWFNDNFKVSSNIYIQLCFMAIVKNNNLKFVQWFSKHHIFNRSCINKKFLKLCKDDDFSSAFSHVSRFSNSIDRNHNEHPTIPDNKSYIDQTKKARSRHKNKGSNGEFKNFKHISIKSKRYIKQRY